MVFCTFSELGKLGLNKLEISKMVNIFDYWNFDPDVMEFDKFNTGDSKLSHTRITKFT